MTKILDPTPHIKVHAGELLGLILNMKVSLLHADMTNKSSFGKKSAIINGNAFSNMKLKHPSTQLNFAHGNMVFI